MPRWPLMPLMRAGVAAGEERARNLPRPRGYPSGHAPGEGVRRLLLVGSGPAVGWGVVSHELGLAGALARELAAHTKHGYQVDVDAEPEMGTQGVLEAMCADGAERYDAVIVTVGVNDALALTPTSEWREQVKSMVGGFRANFPRPTPLFVVGIPNFQMIGAFGPFVRMVADDHARLLNAVTQEVINGDLRVTYLPLSVESLETRDDSGDAYRTSQQYRMWASLLAGGMLPHLADRPRENNVSELRIASDEHERQHSAKILAIDRVREQLTPRLERIVSQLNRAFGSRSALVTVLDGERQWTLAHAGLEAGEVPRHLSFCNTTVENDVALIVPDTTQDSRFANSPFVTDGPKIRFYAGFPIEAPSGVKIGALCILDTEPRGGRREFNEVFLREMALRAQREIWSLWNDMGLPRTSGTSTAEDG